jgi:HEAT repeat protein
MADPDPLIVKQILAELRDANKDRRRTAVMKLGMLGGEIAVINLIHIVGNRTEDLIVRGRAAQMLGRLRDPRAVDPLIAALDAPGFQTTLHAVESLGMLGDLRAVEPLREMLTNSHEKYREAARAALTQLGVDPDAAGTVSTTWDMGAFAAQRTDEGAHGRAETELPEIVPVPNGDAPTIARASAPNDVRTVSDGA